MASFNVSILFETPPRFDHQTALNRYVGVGLTSTLFALRFCIPLCFWIEPNGNIPTINESSVICGPIGCAVDFVCRLLHLEIILPKKPLRTALCNKAGESYRLKDKNE